LNSAYTSACAVVKITRVRIAETALGALARLREERGEMGLHH